MPKRPEWKQRQVRRRTDGDPITEQECMTIINGWSSTEEPATADDHERRHALAHVFRKSAGLLVGHPPLSAFLIMLANMTDPDMIGPGELQLTITRARGRKIEEPGNLDIARVVWDRIEAGDKRDAAYQQAVDTLKVSYSTAEKALAEWEDFFRNVGPKMKALTSIRKK